MPKCKDCTYYWSGRSRGWCKLFPRPEQKGEDDHCGFHKPIEQEPVTEPITPPINEAGEPSPKPKSKARKVKKNGTKQK